MRGINKVRALKHTHPATSVDGLGTLPLRLTMPNAYDSNIVFIDPASWQPPPNYKDSGLTGKLEFPTAVSRRILILI
jgi:hypothetical protein